LLVLIGAGQKGGRKERKERKENRGVRRSGPSLRSLRSLRRKTPKKPFSLSCCTVALLLWVHLRPSVVSLLPHEARQVWLRLAAL
jgi:hypothetical protein